MKNKKGFTLTELLVVIVLLVVLTGSTVFGIDKISESSKDSQLEKLKKEIELATETYYSNNEIYKKSLLNGELEERCTRLYTLQYEGLIGENLINPYTNKRIQGNLCVTSRLNEDGIIIHNLELLK